MFKRRTKRSYTRMIAEGIYPRGGWTRAISYIFHRIRRLPDRPHRIARGIAVGVFVCFTPFFGLHIIFAAIITWAIQGNILAALLATFFGNPFTFPIIAKVSLELGSWMLDLPGSVPFHILVNSFSNAAVEVWYNFTAIFLSHEARWDQLAWFGGKVMLPYLVGGLFPGAVCAAIAYALSQPLIAAYQKARIKRLKKKFLKRQEAEARRVAKEAERELEKTGLKAPSLKDKVLKKGAMTKRQDSEGNQA